MSIDVGSVETVLGPRPARELGTTLMHEHVFVLDRELETNYLEPLDEDMLLAEAVTKLRAAEECGVRTIVDLTVLGLGRYVPRVRDVARHVNVAIVVATGLYTWDDVPMFFRMHGPGKLVDGPEILSEFFVRDLTEGIGDTGVKAGILKCATDSPGMTPGVERVLRAVALAHRETGAPISTHTHAGTRRGLEQLAVFQEEGVDLGRVVIGHCGDTTDLDYLKQIIDAGAYIGMDRFGSHLMLPPEDRLATVVELCDQGYADRMVLSHDAPCFSHILSTGERARLTPDSNYTYISKVVRPELLERGVSQAQIDQMLLVNPMSILAYGGA